MRRERLLAALVLLMLLVTGCSFGPKRNTVGTVVGNGQIVLLRRGSNSYGVFIPSNQLTGPDRLRFRWYYRTDGRGTFKRSDVGHYRSGSGVGVSDSSVPYLVARFGPFSVGWSGHENGKGYLYYTHFAHERVAPDDVRICVTRETDIGKVDATGSKWVYSGSPDDPGVRGRTR